MKKLFLITLILSSLNGCTSSAKLGNKTPSRIEPIDFKSYEIGSSQTSYVGENILSRKSYNVLVQSNAYQAKQEFSLSGGLASVATHLKGNTGDTYQIMGTNEKGNDIILIPGSHLMFGINKSGNWDNTVVSANYWTSPIGSGSQYAMKPDNVLFEKVETRLPLSDSGYINHELVFTGLGADGITVLYREYTFENNARSAFTQELVYPKDAKTIRFRNYQIVVKSVSSESISYVVARD